MGLKYIEPHEITYYECDFHQQLTIPMLINILIKTSESQTNQIANNQILIDNHLGWIITQYDIEITRLPKNGETVYITTEAESYNKYFCYRNFWLHSRTGKLLVKLQSVFSLMNLQTRKIAPITAEIVAAYQAEATTKLKRLTKIEQCLGCELEKTYQVRYFDLDTNAHVNNARYFDWLMDALEMEFLTHYEPKAISIKFEKEVSYGDQVTSHVTIADNKQQTYHEITNQGIRCAEAMITWRMREKD